MNPLANKLNDMLEYEFQEGLGFKYAASLEEASSYQVSFSGLKELVEKKEYTLHEWHLPWLFEIAIFHYEYSIYALVKLNNKMLFKQHLSLATHYAYVSLSSSSESCGCYESKNPFIIINKATFMMSNLLLTHEYEAFEVVGTHLIDSLNSKSCIIKKGYNKASISWFVLKLFSLYSRQEITLHKLLQPKLEAPYANVLDNWDTTEATAVIIMIDALCEMHLLQAKEDYEQTLQEEYNSLEYKELFIVASYSLPFEVLAWLQLREKAGLKNPTEFSHPLMNTPVAKMFLDIKEPLEKPKELPYVKELLEKLQKKCPKITLPDWI